MQRSSNILRNRFFHDQTSSLPHGSHFLVQEPGDVSDVFFPNVTSFSTFLGFMMLKWWASILAILPELLNVSCLVIHLFLASQFRASA